MFVECEDTGGRRSYHRTMNSRPTLPPNFAFVVQFTDGSLCEAMFSGRVEHVISGRSARFESEQQLLQFMHNVLDQVSQPE